MNDLLIDEFQENVNTFLLRNKSILDTLTKFQDSVARVNRAIVKSATHCGCIQINAKKQKMPDEDMSLSELKNFANTHVSGKLCDSCRDKIESELGNTLFYLFAICNTLDISAYDVFVKEQKRLSTLGFFNLL